MCFPACLSCFSGKRPGATADAGPASGGHARSADLTRVARGQQRRHQPSGLAPRGARAAGTAGKEGPCPADTAAGGVTCRGQRRSDTCHPRRGPQHAGEGGAQEGPPQPPVLEGDLPAGAGGGLSARRVRGGAGSRRVNVSSGVTLLPE